MPTRARLFLPLAALSLTLGAATALAREGWMTTRDEGLAAARKSGRPVLVVTIWPPGV